MLAALSGEEKVDKGVSASNPLELSGVNQVRPVTTGADGYIKSIDTGKAALLAYTNLD